MSRRKPTKVVIRLKTRSDPDPKKLLDAIEQSLRPKEIEIHAEINDEPSEDFPVGIDENRIEENVIADEQLETKANEEASEILDKQDEAVKSGEIQTDVNEEEKKKLAETLKKGMTATWGVGWKVAVTEFVKCLLGG